MAASYTPEAEFNFQARLSREFNFCDWNLIFVSVNLNKKGQFLPFFAFKIIEN